MNSTERTTQEAILLAGKEEFLQKGFLGASLRNIVKNAGVTTGAFYGYYASKEELFDALVGEQEAHFLGCFQMAQDDFSSLPPQKQPDNMGEISGTCISLLLDYMYEYPEEFRLLLCYSEGTKHAGFVHTLVEIEIEATNRFVQVLDTLGYSTRPIDAQLEHMLVSGMFSAFFETVIHDMPKEQAVRYTKELQEFYTAGWKKIMGL